MGTMIEMMDYFYLEIIKGINQLNIILIAE